MLAMPAAGGNLYVFGCSQADLREAAEMILYKLDVGVAPLKWAAVAVSNTPPARYSYGFVSGGGGLWIYGGRFGGKDSYLNDLFYLDVSGSASQLSSRNLTTEDTVNPCPRGDARMIYMNRMIILLMIGPEPTAFQACVLQDGTSSRGFWFMRVENATIPSVNDTCRNPVNSSWHADLRILSTPWSGSSQTTPEAIVALTMRVFTDEASFELCKISFQAAIQQATPGAYHVEIVSVTSVPAQSSTTRRDSATAVDVSLQIYFSAVTLALAAAAPGGALSEAALKAVLFAAGFGEIKVISPASVTQTTNMIGTTISVNTSASDSLPNTTPRAQVQDEES
jgi:hypothetical protein